MTKEYIFIFDNNILFILVRLSQLQQLVIIIYYNFIARLIVTVKFLCYNLKIKDLNYINYLSVERDKIVSSNHFQKSLISCYRSLSHQKSLVILVHMVTMMKNELLNIYILIICVVYRQMHVYKVIYFCPLVPYNHELVFDNATTIKL